MSLRGCGASLFFSALLILAPACGDGVAGGSGGAAEYGDVGVGAAGHELLLGGVWHMAGNEDPLGNCAACHGEDLQGGTGTDCYACHDAAGHTKKRDGFEHKGGSSSSCEVCHGPNNSGGLGPACAPCHKQHD